MSMATLLPLTETPDAIQIFSVSSMVLWLQIARRLGKSRSHAACKRGKCSGLRAWNANVALSLRLAQTWNIKGGGSGETPQELRRPPRQNQSGPSERKAIVSHWRAARRTLSESKMRGGVQGAHLAVSDTSLGRNSCGE